MLTGDMLRRSAERFPDKTAIIGGDVRIGYAMLDARSNQLANAVLHAGVRKGGKVAILSRNLPEYGIVFFGLARSGAVMGTPSYMAPEQAGGKGNEVGPPTDVYALGAMLYEFLTGRPPFKAATPLDTILQVLSSDPVPVRELQPATPRDLETICLKCLQKAPGKRYATALDLAEDLRCYQAGEPIRALPVGRWSAACAGCGATRWWPACRHCWLSF